jgi:hypothetical protein
LDLGVKGVTHADTRRPLYDLFNETIKDSVMNEYPSTVGANLTCGIKITRQSRVNGALCIAVIKHHNG